MPGSQGSRVRNQTAAALALKELIDSGQAAYTAQHQKPSGSSHEPAIPG
jgi:hypothetical protein